jgi:peptidoglycan-associated lipoprotein
VKIPKIRLLLTAVFLLPLILALMGCPKKPPEPESSPKTAVTTGTLAPPPGPGPTKPGEEELSPLAGGKLASQQKDAEKAAAQMAALRNEDIPLAAQGGKEFVTPTAAAEKLVFKNVLFDYDQSEIKPEYRPILDGIAVWMNGNPSRQLLVEGHCDERGTNEYNLALGERRALSVRRYLVSLGLHPERIHTISYGEERPLDPAHTEAAWAVNRRAEFKVSAAE